MLKRVIAVAEMTNRPDVEKWRQTLAEKTKQEKAITEEIRAYQRLYADATNKLFEEISTLARELGLNVTQGSPKTVQNTMIDEYFQIVGDLTVSRGARARVSLIPGDLMQNLVPAAFSGIGVQTEPPNLLPFDELFFAERDQLWVVRVKAGSHNKPIYETKSISAEALIRAAFLREQL